MKAVYFSFCRDLVLRTLSFLVIVISAYAVTSCLAEIHRARRFIQFENGCYAFELIQLKYSPLSMRMGQRVRTPTDIQTTT